MNRENYNNNINLSNIVKQALLDGRLVKLKNCEKCGKERELVAHHRKYFKPLEVEWICRSCLSKIYNSNFTKNNNIIKNRSYWDYLFLQRFKIG